ncbi:DUF418 domain-containing protein [Tenggerimyces flavus]|uniref:DUF418 domain-containing protein n=1 Tax=Tenggerimyces flavus TaxID=1708749 RepID=A0ABV7YAH5_9ACTN|nr:DUF418 domain-containing protein [Tenggerimyces flavus]MBM7786142.1 putative membrane protein YeiB [Tenggerimyces flavus]
MSTTTPVDRAPAGPLAVGQRKLAPDLARGAMLLFIALANAHEFLRTTPVTIRGYPTSLGPLDQAVTAILMTVVDGRAYPMFAALFGYGMVQIFARQEASGRDWRSSRSLLRRRGRWMVVIGLLHALLLFAGDIIAAYGVLALLLVGALRSKLSRLPVWAWIALVAGSLTYAIFALPLGFDSAGGPPNPFGGETFVEGMIARGASWIVTMPLFALTAIAPFLIGVWAGRRRILDEPERFRSLLTKVSTWGVAGAIVGGIPLALVAAQVIPVTSISLTYGLGVLHTATGYLGGIGYAAAIALLATRIGTQRGVVVEALAATGQRSMTSYLLQSVIWTTLFLPYTLNLGAHLGVAATALISIGAWALTVVLAALMQRAHLRGPFEGLLRRLTYRT